MDVAWWWIIVAPVVGAGAVYFLVSPVYTEQRNRRNKNGK